MAGFKFLEAFAQFGVDRTSFDKSLKDMQGEAEKGGRSIEKSFSEGFKRGIASGGETIERVGEIAGKVATAISSPWALAAAAVGLVATEIIRSTEAGLEFDREYSKVRVLLSGTNTELRETREQIFRVGGGLVTGAEAAGVFRKALLDTGSRQAAEELSRVAIQLARISGAAPIQIVELLGSVLDATGKKASDAADVAGKLFDLMRHGGGDIQELGGGFLQLVDVGTSLGLSLEEINGMLIRLGEIAGSRPQAQIRGLTMTLAALQANMVRLREQGLDLDATVKAEGAVGVMKLLNVATGGTREGLRDLAGVQGPRANAMLKLMGDTAQATGHKLEEAIAGQQAAGKNDLAAALQENLRSASSQLDKFKKELEERRTQRGLGLLDLVNIDPKLSGPALDAALEEIAAKIEATQKRLRDSVDQKGLGQFFTKPAERAFGEERDQKFLAQLEGRRAALEAQKAVQDKATEAQRRATAATEEGTRATQEAGAEELKRAETKRRNELEIERLARLTGIKTGDLKGSPQTLEKARQLADTITKVSADAQARGEELLQGELTRNQQRVQSTLSTTLAITESERALDIARARVEGRAAQGLENLLALRQRAAKEGTQAELDALEQVTAAQTRAAEARLDDMRQKLTNLRARGGFEDNPDLRKQALELGDQIAAGEATLTKLQQDAALKRLTTEQKVQTELAQMRQKAFEERRAQITEEQRLDDQAFAHRLAMGQATIREEIDRARVMSMDPDRTQEERFRFAEQARSRERQVAQEAFEFLKSINRLTLQDYVATQQAIVDASKRGTQERLDAEKRLADAVREMRAAAAGAAGSLFDLAATNAQKRRDAGIQAEIDRLRAPAEEERRSKLTPEERRIEDLEKQKQQPVALSSDQLAEEFAKARAEAMGAAQTFAAGGAITPDQFKAMGAIAGINDQLSVFGGGLAGATNALQQFAKNLLVPFGDELKTRGIGGTSEGLASATTPLAGDSAAMRSYRAELDAELARLQAQGLEAGGGSSEGWMGAKAALGRSYAATPDTSAAERPDLAGSRAASGAEAAARIRQGMEEGAAQASAIDLGGVARDVVIGIYRGVYDKLATDLEREAARL